MIGARWSKCFKTVLYDAEMSSFKFAHLTVKLFRSLERSFINASSLKFLKHQCDIVIYSDLMILLFVYFFLAMHTEK